NVGQLVLDFDGATRLQVVPGGEAAAAAQINLERGRVIVRQARGPITLLVAAVTQDPAGEAVGLRPVLVKADAAPLAMERLARPDASSPITLRVYAGGSKLTLRPGETDGHYDAPTAVDVAYAFPENLPADAVPTFVPKPSEVKNASLPDWASDQADQPVDSQPAELFA